MAVSKYEKYILRQTGPAKISAATPASLKGLRNWSGVQHRMTWNHISKPVVMDKVPHSHDFDEFLCFVGDPKAPFEFGAEVELSLGKEGEKQTIDASTIVCIPKGLIHGPLAFKKVHKPVLFCDIYMAPEYVKKPVSK